MLRVPIYQAMPHMVLARPVPHPREPEHTLLKSGFELDEETVTRLKSLRVKNLWINYPDLDFLDEMLDPEVISGQQQLYGTLKEQFNENQQDSLAKLDYKQYVKHMTDLFERLLRPSGPAPVFLAELETESSDIFSHSITVASLAGLIALRLEPQILRGRPKLPARLAMDLTQLGMGALLHDIGKLSLPKELQGFHQTAQDFGTPEWQQHTEAGIEMIHGGLDPTAGQIVINHHQHFDGSGFPARTAAPGCTEPIWSLKGDQIHIFCRIATIADRYDGFRYLPDGTVAPAVVALKRMRNPGYTKWFDPEVYQAFMQTVPPFPPGQQVTLSDGREAVVTELNEKTPCRPIVRPIDLKAATEKNNKPSKSKSEDTEQPPDINLLGKTDIHIASVGGFDVKPYLY